MTTEGSDPIPELDTRYDPRHVQDHVETAPDKLLEQFKERPIFAALLRVFVAEFQKVEDAAWEVTTFRRIDSAEGDLLDRLGAIVVRPRGDLGDIDYRIAIRAQIRILKSTGRPEDLIAIALLSTPLGTDITYIDEYPAGLRIDVRNQVTWPVSILFAGLRQARCVAVRAGLIWSVEPEGTRFRFSASTTASETSATEGFGWDGVTLMGGKMRELRVT